MRHVAEKAGEEKTPSASDREKTIGRKFFRREKKDRHGTRHHKHEKQREIHGYAKSVHCKFSYPRNPEAWERKKLHVNYTTFNI